MTNVKIRSNWKNSHVTTLYPYLDRAFYLENGMNAVRVLNWLKNEYLVLEKCRFLADIISKDCYASLKLISCKIRLLRKVGTRLNEYQNVWSLFSSNEHTPSKSYTVYALSPES